MSRARFDSRDRDIAVGSAALKELREEMARLAGEQDMILCDLLEEDELSEPDTSVTRLREMVPPRSTGASSRPAPLSPDDVPTLPGGRGPRR